MRPERYKTTYTLTSFVMDWLERRSDLRFRTRSKQLETDLKVYRALLDDGFSEVTLSITHAEFEVIAKILRPVLAGHEDIVLLAKTDLKKKVSEGLRFLSESERGGVNPDALKSKLGKLTLLQRVALCDRIAEKLWSMCDTQGELIW